jgi:predicted nucleic acid-binding protein
VRWDAGGGRLPSWLAPSEGAGHLPPHWAEVRTKRAVFAEAILERFPLLPVDLGTARTHAQVWAEMAAADQMIGPHDLWLAATCSAHGLTMVTANVREFARVPGLTVEVWGSPR